MTRWLPAILLVAIALHQIARAEMASLSPWKGGGFGMFATTDRGLNRRVLAFALSDDGAVRLSIPGDRANLVQRARALPDPRRLERLAAALGEAAAERVPGARAVRVEVWRIAYDRALALHGVPLGEATVALGGGGDD